MLPSGILTCCTGPFWSGSLCLFGFCLPSLRCLTSALAQAGGGDLLFRFASSAQSCCGEGGVLRADVTVRGEHSPCSGQAARSFGGLSLGAVRIFPPRRAAGQQEGLAPSPWARRTFSLSGSSALCWSGLKKSSYRNRACLQCGRGWLLSIMIL